MNWRPVIVILIFCFALKNYGQTPLQANAGNNFTLCPGSTVIIGSSIPSTGGLPPYSYQWSPAASLSSATVANPTLTAIASGYYYFQVRDANDNIAKDSILITVPNLSQYTAGNDTSYCPGHASNIVLGNPINASATGCIFNWLPTSGLNNPTLPNPVANPTTTTVYSLTVTKGSCSIQTGTVSVSLVGLSLYVTFNDTTIKEGITISLHAISPSATSFTWNPQFYFIKYQYTANPDVEPIVSTTYSVTAIDETSGCIATDTVRVRVTPDDQLIFYSAFTPNNDGDNDFFYIGNIYKYPDNVLKVYNRYGQIIYTSAGYKNDWDGSYQGNKVPTGTYFYILDSGTSKGKYAGSVTILR